MKNVVPMLLFNLFEIACTVLFGVILDTKPLTILIIMGTWIVVRIFVDKPMHYKNPVKCFFMTLFLFISIFLATKVDLYLGIIVVVFDGIVMSKYGNINEVFLKANENLFQWNNLGNNRRSKYQELIDFIEQNPNNPILLEFEDYWSSNYKFRHIIYIKFFKNRYTYERIASELKLGDNTKIKQECKIIYSTLERPLNLKPVKEFNKIAV